MERLHLLRPDGRRVGYLELGDPAGAAAIHLHGTPSSASEARWLDAPARGAGVRLIALDRPGYPGSDPLPCGSFPAVAADVVALADHLGLEWFAVTGFSGGAGYALATAHLAPGRVSVVHLGGGMGSMADAERYGLAWWRRLMFAAVGRAPRLSAPPLGLMLGRVAHALDRRLADPGEAAAELYEGAARGAQVEAVAEYIRTAAPADLRADVGDHIAATRATRAVIADMAAVVRPWPFPLAGVTTPVELWHGTDDPAVPLGYAQGLASDLGNARVHPCAGEGHFVFHTHGGEVVASIRDHAGRTTPQTRS